MPTIKRYFPRLNEVISLDDLPRSLEFVKTTLNSIFSQLHYKDFQYSKSASGNSGFYSVKIISRNRLEFEIPGTGVYLVLNPTDDNTNISATPVTIDYEWKILGLLQSFNDSSYFDGNADFSATVDDVLALAQTILKFSDKIVVSHAINKYAIRPDNSNTPIQQFVSDVNAYYAPSNSISNPSPSSTDPVGDVVTDIEANLPDIPGVVVLNTYIKTADIEESWDNLTDFLRMFTAKDIKDFVLDYITPKVKATLGLKGAIELPRSWIQPVDEATFEPIPEDVDGQGVPLGTPRAQFAFVESLFHFDSQTSSGIQTNFALTSATPVMFGKTGLIVDIKNLKLDTRDDKNIEEADADGRPLSFKGVYVEEAEIFLPPNWIDNGANPKITGRNLLMGSEGGVSGEINVDGYNIEKHVSFTFNQTDPVVVDETTGVITVTGLNNEKIEFDYAPSAEPLFIRDIDDNYRKIDRSVSPPVITVEEAPNGILNYEFKNGLKISLDAFHLELRQNKIIDSSVSGTLEVPSFDEPIKITAEFNEGFLIKAYVPSGKAIVDNNKIKVTLNGLEIGKSNDKHRFGFGGRLDVKSAPPFFDKFVPSYIDIENLLFQSGEAPKFNVGIGWESGFSVKGSDDEGLEIIIPIHKNKEKTKSDKERKIQIDSIKIAAKSDETSPDESILNIDTTLLGAILRLGSVTAIVEDFGFQTTVKLSDETGNLGNADIDLKIIGPSAVGIEIESDKISGGGFLKIDKERGLYHGLVSLKIADKISVQAIGLLQTKLPNGKKGFSLLLLVYAKDFVEIQLGFGFTLNGIGGLLGLNRRADVDELRAGVYDGSLDDILFPENIVQNAPSLISSIDKKFPTSPGHFLIGPMFKIHWGTDKVASILSIDLGIIIQIPDPVISVLGVIKTLLPKREENTSSENVKFYIQINFLGVIDFKNKKLAFDASIVEGRLVTINLTGDIAFRFYWGEKANFLLSAGGFHPAYTPPPMDLPEMRRISVTPLETDKVVTRLDAYFAITSNTVQIGAKLFAEAKFGRDDKYKAIAVLWLDALFQFRPFYMIVEMGGMVAILRKDKELAVISIVIALQGPGPWKIDGRAYVKLFGIEFEVKFNAEFGKTIEETVESILIKTGLDSALQSEDNWDKLYLDRQTEYISVNSAAPKDEIKLHPMGMLAFNQTYVPLNVMFNRFGNANPGDYKKFTLDTFTVNGASTTKQWTKDNFAASQFFSLTNDERLSRPSFEKYDSGFVIGDQDVDFSHITRRELTYDIDFIDREIALYTDTYTETADSFNNAMAFNSAGLSKGAGKNPINKPHDAPVAISTSGGGDVFTINYEDDQVQYGTSTYNSLAEAQIALDSLLESDASLQDQLLILADTEL